MARDETERALGGVLRAVRRVRRLLSAGEAASARLAALTAGARAFLTRDRLTLVLRFFIAVLVERFLLALTERFLVERFLTDDDEDLAERFFTGEEVVVERFLAGEDVFAERFLLEERLLTVDVDRFLAGDVERLLFAERLLTILPGTSRAATSGAAASRALTVEDEATGTVRAATAASVSDRFRCS